MKRNLIYHTHIAVENIVAVETSSGECNTQLEAIARDGLTLTCNRKTLDQLLPNTVSISPKQPKNLNIHFQLNDAFEAIQSSCEVYSLRRLARDTFQLDMHFNALEEKHFKQIDNYIENSLKQLQPQLKQVA